MTADRDLERLIDIVAAGVRVLRTRDGVPVSEEQCTERARNIVSAVVVTFELRALPPVPEGIDERITHPQAWPAMKIKEWARLDFDTPLNSLEFPIGHGWSCQCTKCHTLKQKRRT